MLLIEASITAGLLSAEALIPALILFTGMLASLLLKKLTLAGALTGGLMGALVYSGAGYSGLAMLGAFFVLGTLATLYRRAEKPGLSSVPAGGPAADRNPEQTGRTAGQVLANGGVAGLCGLLGIILPHYSLLFITVMAASLASATADTLASELGMLFGRNFYNCISLKRDLRGLDGVISLEGTLIGIIGAALIALIYSLHNGLSGFSLLIIITGAAGNLTDSVLGASLERKGYLGNDMVNFLSTLLAGVLAAIWLILFPV